VTIEGHTDSDGHDDRNETLSWRRAEAVRTHLIASGAMSTQILAIGFGKARPYLPNVSSENKRKNRRATIAVAYSP
jgi:outer membrane protein OmpA-like peptidoglycan-associated protein